MEHFTRATFRFLRELAQHNDKDWFHAHKEDYERHVRSPALALVPAWKAHLPPTYAGRAAKQGGAVSPPHRDLRFGRDKTPYRTHTAIRLRHVHALPGSPGPTFLLWIAPRGCFVSAGVRNVSGEARRRIMDAILADPDAWLEARQGLHLCEDDLLRSAPSAPAALGDDLLRRHFTAAIPIPQRLVASPGLVDCLAEESKRLLPLNQFLTSALYAPPVTA